MSASSSSRGLPAMSQPMHPNLAGLYMPMLGLICGGACRHDIFRRCGLTLPPPPTGDASSKEVQLLMQDPMQKHPKDDLLQWQVPHPVLNPG